MTLEIVKINNLAIVLSPKKGIYHHRKVYREVHSIEVIVTRPETSKSEAKSLPINISTTIRRTLIGISQLTLLGIIEFILVIAHSFLKKCLELTLVIVIVLARVYIVVSEANLFVPDKRSTSLKIGKGRYID